MTTLNVKSAEAPAASELSEIEVGPLVLISAFAVSKVKEHKTFERALDPTFRTRAATGNVLGPTVTLLLSRPIMFQVMAVTVSGLADWARADGAAAAKAASDSTTSAARRRD